MLEDEEKRTRVYVEDDLPEGFEPGQGLNVEVGTLEELDNELSLLTYRLGEAGRVQRSAGEALPGLQLMFRELYAQALQRRTSGKNSAELYSVAKKLAESDCRDLLFEIETEQAKKSWASQRVKILETQISAVQTRARLFIAVYESDMRTKLAQPRAPR